MDQNQTLTPVPWRFCPQPWASPLALTVGGIRGGTVPKWPQFEGARVHLASMGRVALAALLESIAIEGGDEALVPAYHCGSEIDPLIKAGLTPRPFHVSRSLMIDLEHLESLLSERTRVVYITHYFGWSQDLSELARLCTRVGAVLVEDCALSLFSSHAGRPIGTIGDAAIFSFAKSLGVPNGGAVAVRGALPEIHISRGPRVRDTLRASASLARRWMDVTLSDTRLTRGLVRRRDERQARARAAAPDESSLHAMPAEYFQRDATLDRQASRCVRGLLASIDPLDVRTLRRANFLALVDAIGDVEGVTLVRTSLSDGVCPLGAPILVENRVRWIRALRRAGVRVTPWWDGFHPSLMASPQIEAVELKARLILLPVHQGLSVTDMEHIGQSVRRIARDKAG